MNKVENLPDNTFSVLKVLKMPEVMVYGREDEMENPEENVNLVKDVLEKDFNRYKIHIELRGSNVLTVSYFEKEDYLLNKFFNGYFNVLGKIMGSQVELKDSEDISFDFLIFDMSLQDGKFKVDNAMKMVGVRPSSIDYNNISHKITLKFEAIRTYRNSDVDEEAKKYIKESF
jgi:hypothetical protein